MVISLFYVFFGLSLTEANILYFSNHIDWEGHTKKTIAIF